MIPFRTNFATLWHVNTPYYAVDDEDNVYLDGPSMISGVLEIPCSIHKAGTIRQDTPAPLGADVDVDAVVFFDGEDLVLYDRLKRTRAIVDDNGDMWYVSSAVKRRNEIPGMAYCSILLKQAKTPILGIPIEENCVVWTGLGASVIEG